MIFEDGIIKTPDFKFNEKCGGIGKVLFDSCVKYHDRIAVINTATDEWDTYSDLLNKSMATAAALQKRGLEPQNTIALCSNKENINANIPLIAAQFLGCVSFIVDPLNTIEECIEIFEQISPKIVFTIAESKDLISRALNDLKIDVEIILFGEQFRKEFLENKEQFVPIYIEDLSTTSMVQFSSGSTGSPKAICLHHYFFLGLHRGSGFETSVVEPAHHQFNNHGVGPVSLKYSNWYWISSIMDLIITIIVGGCRLLRDKFDVQEFWKTLDKYHVTDAFLMPSQSIELAESIKPKELNISSLWKISIGSANLDKKVVTKLKQMIPNIIITQVYAMTECGVVAAFEPHIPNSRKMMSLKPDSCGMPMDGLQYKVIDMDTGKKCGPNQQGELYIKGKKIFRSFYNKDTSDSFDKEGFFMSGDLVYFDEDFCFYILDRIKNVIRWNIFSIPLYHVEKVLLSHPAVKDAVVIGIPHKREVERMMGVVQLKNGVDNVTEEEIVNYVNLRVEDIKKLFTYAYRDLTVNGKGIIRRLFSGSTMKENTIVDQPRWSFAHFFFERFLKGLCTCCQMYKYEGGDLRAGTSEVGLFSMHCSEGFVTLPGLAEYSPARNLKKIQFELRRGMLFGDRASCKAVLFLSHILLYPYLIGNDSKCKTWRQSLVPPAF